MTRFTYQHLLELVGGDDELIVQLVEEGFIEHSEGIASVDLDRILLARTIRRDLDVDWAGIEIIIRLAAELKAARQRIAELEAVLSSTH